MTDENKATILKMIELETLYVPYARFTRHPFAVCNPETFDDQLMVFSTDPAMDKYCKELFELKNQVYAVALQKKRFLEFFLEMHTLGFNQVVFEDEEGKHYIDLSDIVPYPDFENTQGVKPHLNPQFQLSAIYFIQEATRAVADSEKPELRGLEEEVAANLSRAELFLPLFLQNPDEKEVKEGSFGIPVITNDKGQSLLPLFTDANEFTKFNKEKKFRSIKLTLDKAVQFYNEKMTGYAINPFGVNLVLTQAQVDGVIKRFLA